MKTVPITVVRHHNAANGKFFFSPDTIHFFRCRTGRRAYETKKGWYFVTSEQFSDTMPRLYSVRFMDRKGRVSTIGEFQQYKTRQGADAKALSCAVRED